MSLNKASLPLTAYPWSLFRLAFRPFFLFGSLFSIISLLIWNTRLGGQTSQAVYGGDYWWHMHEMLFGFVAAIIVGFLLTAVQTWTRLPSIQGKALIALFLLWLCARLSMWLPGLLPSWVIIVTDLLFLPVAAGIMARLVIQAGLWRNLIFVPLLLAMTACNLYMHYAVLTQAQALAQVSATAMVLLVTILMAIMGGRVFPMFTANATHTRQIQPIFYLELAAILSLLLLLVVQIGWLTLSPPIHSGILFVAAGLHFIRALRWRVWVAWRLPLVWSLHVGYFCIPLGLLLLALSEITPWVAHSQAIHSLTVGAMGTMILAMIARVSLGHTGRPIQVGGLMSGALILIFIAFLTRVFGAYYLPEYQDVLTLSSLFWAIAYACFFILYLPVLSRPRRDGQPG